MKKTLHKHPLGALLVAVCLLWAAAPAGAQTLRVGYTDGAGDGAGIYNGSYFDLVPTNFYLCYSGSQFIYMKDELAPLAGKTITKVQFPYYNEGVYESLSRRVRLYVWETDETAFRLNPENNSKTFFPPSLFTQVADEEQEYDFFETAYEDGVLTITLSAPYTYSGDHNLVLQAVFEGDVNTDFTGIWFYESPLTKRGITYVSDKVDFFAKAEETLDADATKSCGTNLSLPFTTFVYDGGDASGIVSVGNPSAARRQAYDLLGRPASGARGLRIADGKKTLK